MLLLADGGVTGRDANGEDTRGILAWFDREECDD
jgi:hypothetical protein